MQSSAIVLASNISVAAAQPGVAWRGGRASLVINASTYPTTCNIEVQGPSGAWIKLNGSTIAADSVTSYDVPAGQVRLNMTGGTAAGVYASLVTIPYG